MGMIGGGGNAMIGPIHLRAALMENDIELVCGCFSRNYQTSLSTGLAWHVPCERIYHDYKEMLEKEKPELVAICSTSGSTSCWTNR